MPPRPRRSSRAVGLRTARRRTRVWAQIGPLGLSVTTGGALVTDLLQEYTGVAGVSLLGVTILRTHLTLNFPMGSSVNNNFRLGLIVGRVEDITLTTLDPGNHPSYDWMLAQLVYQTSSGATVDQSVRHEIDLRSMRRMHDRDQRYLLTLMNGTGATQTVGCFGRILLALP